MADTPWTVEQMDAITEKGCNLLVSAAAGAGKTAVLTERIIRKITDDKNPIDIDKMLIVTFTNAAAAEMRDRIATKISERLEANPESGNIQRQLALLGKACITTIHSFCLEVIRSNFQNINLDPGFRICDETESALLKLDALNEVFEECYEADDHNFFELLESYGGNRDDQALQDMVLDLYSFIQSSPNPQKWLNEHTENLKVSLDPDFSQTPWGRELVSSVKLELEGLKAMLNRALGLLQNAAGLEKYGPVFNDDFKKIKGLLRLINKNEQTLWDELFSSLHSINFDSLPPARKDADVKIKEKVKSIRDDVKTRIKNLLKKQVTALSADLIKDLNVLYLKIKHLATIVELTAGKYAEKKSRKAAVDFNDLEHFCLEILSEKGEDGVLRPSQVALAYRERFEEILVDEYQDINMAQETIVNLLSREDTGNPNVFMVGDVKQSIYRFRQARPELFLSKYKQYSLIKGNALRKILLFNNFRSRKEVLDAVNYIFKQIMSVNAGELDYTDDEALLPGAKFPDNEISERIVGGAVELHLLQTAVANDAISQENEAKAERDDETEHEEGEKIEEDEEMLDNIQCEARLVGRRILELMGTDDAGRHFCVFDKENKEYRKIEFKDIVILLRTTINWAETFVEEFSKLNIPNFADTGTGFFKSTEVQVMLSLLQLIDNPLQDIPLLSVLRSPIVSFATDELAELRLIDKEASLFDALLKLAANEQEGAADKAASFLEKLKNWREDSSYLPVDQLLWKLYDDTGYYAMVGAMPIGEQRQANLRILFERARQFEKTGQRGLFNFISFIDKLKSSKWDMGSAKVLGENENVVRIMSVHKSKGLEFPVVILSGCGKKFNLQDMNKNILFHQDLGFGPDNVDHKLRLSWPSAAKQAIREKIRLETLSEEMRILYVALTRAKEKLIITGSIKDICKQAGKWAVQADGQDDKLPDYEILKGANYLDWIGPSLIRHKGVDTLRNHCSADDGFQGLLIDDPSLWKVRIWNKSDVLSGKVSAGSDEYEFIDWLDGLKNQCISDSNDEVIRRLSWEYPHAAVASIPAKITVTELKRRFNAQVTEDGDELLGALSPMVKKPKFLEETKGLTAAEAGIALHFVMRHLNFQRDDYEIQIGEMVSKNLLTQQQAQSVDVEKISIFFQSNLGRRLLASGSISREVPFNLEIPCNEVYKDMTDEKYKGETILLQGVIDCFFEEQDGIVLVDYKTDYAATGMGFVIKDRYKVQIDYYARAIETLTGKKVVGKYIYLFSNGEILTF